jgi:hypothetical protein
MVCAKENSTPKLSVLIPVYNGGRYLSECLESILTQGFKDMEILVSDDGSTDHSPEIIKDFALRDRRIRWWRNPRNLGLTENANACLSEARGEFIKFVFQDDALLSAGTVQAMVDVLETNPSITLVASAVRIMDEQSRTIEKRNCVGKTSEMDGKAVIIKCFEENGNLIGAPSAVMFRRQCAARGFDAKFQQLMDLEMWFHLLEQGRLYWIAETLAAFRQHAEQQTAINRKNDRSGQEMLALFESYFQKPWLKADATQKMLCVQARFFQRKFGKQTEELVKELRRKIRPGMSLVFWLERKFVRPLKKRMDKIR